MYQNLSILIFIFFSQFVIPQKENYKTDDTLKNKSYDYYDDKAYKYKEDSLKADIYLFAHLSKAKREQNWKEIANAYRNISNQSSEKLSLIYADSIIYAAKKTKDDSQIGSAYLSKGIAYYALKRHNEAMDNYILANSFLARSNNEYLVYKLKYHIALVKYYLGYYNEAISLLKECMSYFKNRNSHPYLTSLHSLGLCYNRNGDYGLCSETNMLGISQCKKLGIPEMEVYFIHSQGINEYFRKNYASAIKNIEFTIKPLKEKNDFGNEAVGYFYIGKSYWRLENYEKAIPYFEKVDYLFQTKGYMRPDLREVYELLITYYKINNNPKFQLYYVDQLLKADRMLNDTFQYLVGRINKEYNTQELLIEKENLKKELSVKNYRYYTLIGFTSLLFSAFITLAYRNLKNRKLYKQRFEKLMLEINNPKDKNSIKEKNEKPSMLDINPETVSSILKKLEKFENDKKYLDKDWKLSKLSTALNSNPTYLSSIIHHHKQKNFNEYINDLKIDYIISLLNSNKLTRNYKNKALADESGFSTTERFTKAFKAKTGMPTAYFIEQIKKENNVD